jgi:hypothetical protein
VRKQGALPVLVLAAALALPAGAAAETHVVDLTSAVTNDELCSLSEAITASNDDVDVNPGSGPDCDDGTSGADTIQFDAAFNGETGDVISLAAPLPTITEELHIDGSDCDPGPAPKPCVEVAGTGAATVLTITATAPGSSLRGLAITNGTNGVTLSGAGSSITGSWFGVKLDGTTSSPNSSAGVLLGTAATGAVVGGTATEDRNVLYANPTNLIVAGTADVDVLGNWLGLLPDGSSGATAPTNNISLTEGAGAPATGTEIGAADSTTPGVCDLGCNAISRATGSGIFGSGSGSMMTTTIAGNFIGLDTTGTLDRGNNNGISLTGSSGTTIGGPTAASRNYIGGNANAGIIAPATASGVTIRNNFIGLAASGASGIPDGASGVELQTTAADVVVAGNRFGGDGTDPNQGVSLTAAASNSKVQGNTFGVGTGGENLALSSFGAGINISGSSHLIGGSGAGEGNVIGNVSAGVLLGDGASGNTIEGNLIGTTAAGADIGTTTGISAPAVVTPVTDNTIGGTTGASENVISNGVEGIEIALDGSDGNAILRNRGAGNSGLFLDLRDHVLSEASPGNGVGNTASGPNEGIQEPVVGSARRRQDRVKGTGAAGATVRVHRSFGPAGDAPNGLKKYLGKAVVGSAGGWRMNPAGTLKKGWTVSANQTDADGNSSEFALAKKTRR